MKNISINIRIKIFDQVLFDVVYEYISLSDEQIDVIPNNSFEFLKIVLDSMDNDNKNNPYKESFLLSLQFIFQDYFAYLKVGNASLMRSESDDEPSRLEITLDSKNQIINFEAINMSSVEEDKTLLRILSLEKDKKIGPVPMVSYRYRKSSKN